MSLSVSFRHSNVNVKFIANNVVSREVIEAYNILSIYSSALLLVFLFLHVLVVGSVRQIKLTDVGFRAHVKIASRMVSYRIT